MKDKGKILRSLVGAVARVSDKRSRLENEPRSFTPGVKLPPRLVHALQAVGLDPGVNIRDLAASFSITKSAASQMAARLVRAGLAEKEPAPHSGKEVRLFLTDRGWHIFRIHEKLHRAHLDDLAARLARFTARDLATASAVLEFMVAALDDRLENPQGRWNPREFAN